MASYQTVKTGKEHCLSYHMFDFFFICYQNIFFFFSSFLFLFFFFFSQNLVCFQLCQSCFMYKKG